MTMNMKNMKKEYDKHQTTGEFWSPPVGDSLVYIHPPCRPDDEHPPTAGTNFAAVAVHYGIGEENKMVVCLDTENNPILRHPFIEKQLKKRKVKLTGNCPVEKLLDDSDFNDSTVDRMKVQTRYLWGITPIAHRVSSSGQWTKSAPQPSVMFVGRTIFEGVMREFFDCGDITDFKSATYLIIRRKGTKMNTKYTISVDARTLKKPQKLKKEFVSLLKKAMKQDGPCDLFSVINNVIKSEEKVSAQLSGVPLEEDDDEDYDDEELNEEDSTDDSDDSDSDDNSDDSDEDDDEDPDDSDEEDPDPDDDDDEDPDDPDDDDDEDPDDPDDDDDEDPEESDNADDDEDSDLDDLDAQLAELAARKKKKTTKAKTEKKTKKVKKTKK